MNLKTGKRTWLRHAGLFGVAALAAATIAACASASSTGPGQGGQPSATASGAPTASAAPSTTASAAPPTGAPLKASALPHASCGSALTHGLNRSTQVLHSDKGALNCFHTAAQACKAASLAVTEMGVDTGIRNVITIEPSGSGCQVTLWHQSYSANNGGRTSAVSGTYCTLGTVTSAAVNLSCAGQSMLIPATV